MNAKDILILPNEEVLNALPNHNEGEIAFLEKEQEYRMYHNGKWSFIESNFDSKTNLISFNLYKFNKDIVSQLPPLSEERLEHFLQKLNSWEEKLEYTRYFLLYGKEISYFTLFTYEPNYNAIFGEEVIESLQSIGDIVHYDFQEDNKVEIWVKKDDEATILYLFDYEEGVVCFG